MTPIQEHHQPIEEQSYTQLQNSIHSKYSKKS